MIQRFTLNLLLFLTLLTFADAGKLPTIHFSDINGKQYTVHPTQSGLQIEGMKDTAVFIEFFGHNCPPCLATIPHLIELQKEKKGKLVIIGIEEQGYSTEQLRQFAKRKGINYIVASHEDAKVLVAYLSLLTQWQGGIPFLTALDPKGDIKFTHAGMLQKSVLENIVQKLYTPNAKISQYPTMEFTDINGKSHIAHATKNGLDIEGIKDKVVIVEFFGHRCPPCLATIPHLIELQKQYKDKFAVIAVEVQGYNRDQLRQFVKNKGINYTVASQPDAYALVEHIAVRAQWRGSIPFFVVMDSHGEVRFVQTGMIHKDILENMIKQLYIAPKPHTNEVPQKAESNTTTPTQPKQTENNSTTKEHNQTK